ncbi:hypothetical protein DAMA08_028490 [Martiniozyma asiatica (nom. inval.)]|nr:hypothetical protein DAMA08_028490 [Martiniozyma asiatica]
MPKVKSMKHVSRACLECRSRHMKCDGQEPKCDRCVKYGRDCTYVKSNRGGSRKKGVTKKFINGKSDILPCIKNNLGYLSEQASCNQECLEVENFNEPPNCMKGHIGQNDDASDENIDFFPTFNSSKDSDPVDIVFDSIELPLEKCYISAALTKDLDFNQIIDCYYSKFHDAHPFLPPKDKIREYLDSSPLSTDLLLAMKLIGTGQTTNIYARDVETVNFLVNSIMSYIKQIGRDFISLQTLLLLSMIAHISSLHDLSVLLREALIALTLELKVNLLDENDLPPYFSDVNGFVSENKEPKIVLSISTPTEDSKGKESSKLFKLLDKERVRGIPREILSDTIRRTFWEIYFFDTLSATASGNTKSELTAVHCSILYPKTVPRDVFDFKSRAEACKLVNDSISLNVAIQAKGNIDPEHNLQVQVHLNHMRAALGNWEMKLSKPKTYGMPYMINEAGIVNEGIFEAAMMLNYAKIFTHRPFSYLWRDDVSKHPRCTDAEGIDEPCPTPSPAFEKFGAATDRRKIIETRQTIDSANSLVRTILDTDPCNVTNRTPFLACGLAFSCLVHLSSYAWIETNLSKQQNLTANSGSGVTHISYGEISIYSEYIKLEIASIIQISHHWLLSAKLVQHISETLTKVSPALWSRIQEDIADFKLMNLKVKDKKDATPWQIKKKASSQHIKNSPNGLTPLLQTSLNSPVVLTQTSSAISSLENPTTQATVDLSSDFSTTPGSAFMNDFNQLELNLMNNIDGRTNQQSNEFTSDSAKSTLIEDNYEFNYNYLHPLSPSSDTGCDWIDKHAFSFDPLAINFGASNFDSNGSGI